MHSRHSAHDQALYRNALQRYAVEKTRLGIPQIFQDEALHGYTADGATSFPQAIALCCTWDPELIERVFTAAAQALFGDINPGGKITITFPRSAGDLPAYYYRKPSAIVPYLFEQSAPLFPYGHGLSYTTFKFSNLKLSPALIAPKGATTASVDVANAGSRAGDGVVQLYIRDQVSSATRPVKELKGFQRIRLKPSETRTVSFKLTPAELGFITPTCTGRSSEDCLT